VAEASPTVLGGAAISPEAAFELLVQTELPQAYRTATLVLGDASEAEDAVQEAMLRAWQRIAQLRDPTRAGAWFGRLLMNVCRDRLRTRRPSPTATGRRVGTDARSGTCRFGCSAPLAEAPTHRYQLKTALERRTRRLILSVAPGQVTSPRLSHTPAAERYAEP
jgi:RNA polymerase sigma factor (sigma-70 family)